jgi:hypothetical protein
MPTLTLRFAISEEGFTQDKEWSQPCCRTTTAPGCVVHGELGNGGHCGFARGALG